MKRRTIYWITALVVLALVGGGLFLTGCGMTETGGAVSIGIKNTIREKTILPAQSMDPDEYEVTLANGPETFAPQIVPATQGAVTFESVFPGTYDVTVIARATGVAIGEGSAQVTVEVGETAIVDILVSEYTGLGDLAGTVSWQPDVIATPIFNSYLKDSAGTQTDLTFNVDAVACTGDTSVTDLNSGFYTMVTKIYDGIEQPESLSAGFAEVVRIVKDQTTNFDIYLNAAEGEGEVQININTDGLNYPLEATFNTAPGDMDLVPGQDPTITIETVDTASYTSVWYISGEQVAVDSDSYQIVTADHQMDVRKRLDLILYSADGTRAGSWTWEFKVLDVEPLDQYTLETDFWLDDLSNVDQVRIMYLRDNGTANGVAENSNGDYITAAELTAGVPYTYSYAGLPAGDYLIFASIYYTDGTPQADIWSHGGTSFDDATVDDIIVIPHVGAHLPSHDLGDLD